jgi:hypothetical protein
MGIINPKPRFGLETDSGKIYDYVDQREVEVTTSYQAADGVWNLVKVRDLIATGQPVEAARVNLTPRPVKLVPKATAAPAPNKPAPLTLVVPNHPATAPAELEEGAKSSAGALPPTGSPIALNAKELEALNLSGIQQAALGLTLQERTVTGITVERKAQLGITAARARVLGLNDAQVKALGS